MTGVIFVMKILQWTSKVMVISRVLKKHRGLQLKSRTKPKPELNFYLMKLSKDPSVMPNLPASNLSNSKSAQENMSGRKLDVKQASFQTASGKKFQITVSAMEKAKGVFSDCEVTSADQNCTEFGGFKKASGTTIKVSEDAKNRAKLLFDDFAQEAEIPKPTISALPTDFKSDVKQIGFQTGSGKTFEITADAMERAKGMFSDCGLSEVIPNGFKKASGSTIKISEEAKRRVKNLFDECRDQEVVERDTMTSFPAGFRLESGENCTLSVEKALSDCSVTDHAIKGKKLFSKDDDFSDGDSSFICDTQVLRKVERDAFNDGDVTMADASEPSRKRHLSSKDDEDSLMPPRMKRKVETCSEHVADSRKMARGMLDMIIEKKSRQKAKPIKGLLSVLKSKSKRMTLRELGRPHSNPGCSIDSLSSSDYRFEGAQHFSEKAINDSTDQLLTIGEGGKVVLSDDNSLGLTELSKAFMTMTGVQIDLIPKGWIENHYRWIVWKLAGMEQSYPALLSGSALTPEVVLNQLKFRYDREIDRGQRSALKLIYEGDANPGNCLILCVARCVSVTKGKLLELTDGWYSVPWLIENENPLLKFVRTNRIRVGTKLITFGAELNNHEQPRSPLECPTFEDLQREFETNDKISMLKLQANSTRRSKWYEIVFRFRRFPPPHWLIYFSGIQSWDFTGKLAGCQLHLGHFYPTADWCQRCKSRWFVIIRSFTKALLKRIP